MKIFLIIIMSYLLGSIPFGYITTKLIKKEDVRNFGSGNIGATNVSRVLGAKYGVLVALLDIFKGFTAVWLAQLLLSSAMGSYIPLLAGLFAILGHDYTIFLNFSGGKGVATTLGVILKLFPLILISATLIWIIIVYIKRYVSLASILSASSIPILAFIFDKSNISILFTGFMALLIIFTHRSNIKRLLNGEENQIGGSET